MAFASLIVFVNPVAQLLVSHACGVGVDVFLQMIHEVLVVRTTFLSRGKVDVLPVTVGYKGA